MHQHAGEPDRLLGQAARACLGTGHIVPAGAVGGVDGVEHIGGAPGQLHRLGNIEGNARITDFLLRAPEPLPQRFRREQKGAGDALGRQAQHRLQHQRCACLLRDGRVGADEEELQTLIGEEHGLAGIDRVQFIEPLQLWHGGIAHPQMAIAVDQRAARGGEQPGIGVGGHARARPRFERGHKGLAERILRLGEITVAGRQQGHEPPVTVTGGAFGGVPRAHDIESKGRTSTEPVAAVGQRAAHSSATSRFGTSITQ